MNAVYFDREFRVVVDIKKQVGTLHPAETKKPQSGDFFAIIDEKIMFSNTLRELATIEAKKMVEEHTASPEEIEAFIARKGDPYFSGYGKITQCTSIEEAAKYILSENLKIYKEKQR